MTGPIRKKLIEAALPLPEINDASAYDKMPGIGAHPKGIHHWWARLPLPAARAVLFASVVDDPESHPDKWPTEEDQKVERERLFDIIRRMMGKKLHEAPEVYAEARAEMLRHCGGKLPAVFDPFSGGGSIPLEANRMGFEAHAGDLNPVAVLLNKCNLEIAPQWLGHPPINPEDRKLIGGGESWRGTHGLAADIRYYGTLIRNRAIKQIGHLYPKVRMPKEQGNGEAIVIAWIWARTVPSPNPAAKGTPVPLISTYWLSSKKGKLAWLRPIVDSAKLEYRFDISTDEPTDRAVVGSGTKLGRGAKFKCILTGAPITSDYIKTQAKAGGLGVLPIAVVAEAHRGRIYLPTTDRDQEIANCASPDGAPIEKIIYDSRYLTPPSYNFDSIDKLFSPRQLTALVTLSDLTIDILKQVRSDASDVGLNDDECKRYADAITTFLALAIDRCADFNCTFSTWKASGQQQMHLFTRQAISMVWDFAEANLLGEKAICWHNAVDITANAVETLATNNLGGSNALQIDAATGANGIENLLVSTDPPYYDNVPYADISDFFYVWLRRTLGRIYPELFATLLVPKMQELTASPQRWDGNKERARGHFEDGFRKAFSALRKNMDHRFPLTVYYAFKQDDEEVSSDPDDIDAPIDLTTGWETLLEALISSGFQITGTWPIRASQAWRMRAMGSNALASYIVLACQPRRDDAPQIASNQFRNELKRTLPAALRHLQQGNIAPVDFAQAALGPGMAIYSRYNRILESSGTQLSIRAAINIINQTLTEVLSEVEDEFDAETRWAIAWFEQFGFSEGDFGDAEILSKAKVTSVSWLQQSGVVLSKAGRVRLVRPDELPVDWDPQSDRNLTVWEMTHHLLSLYHYQGAGDEATASLLRKLGSGGETARDLAYRLFKVSEKKKLSQEALGYNALVLGWPEIARLAREELTVPPPAQSDMFGRA